MNEDSNIFLYAKNRDIPYNYVYTTKNDNFFSLNELVRNNPDLDLYDLHNLGEDTFVKNISFDDYVYIYYFEKFMDDENFDVENFYYEVNTTFRKLVSEKKENENDYSFTELEFLVSGISDFLKNYNNYMNITMLKYEDFKDINNLISSYDYSESPKKVLESRNILFINSIGRVKFLGDDIENQNIEVIFNEVKLNDKIPIFFYRNNVGDELIKVYSKPPYGRKKIEKIFETFKERVNIVNNMIYMLYFHNGEQYDIKISTSTSEIIFSSTEENASDINNIISSVIDGIEVYNAKFLSLITEITVTVNNFDRWIFFTMSRIDIAFTKFIYVKENVNPFACKSKNKFYFRSITSILKNKSKHKDPYFIFSKTENENIYKLRVKTQNLDELNELVEVLLKLITIYYELKDEYGHVISMTHPNKTITKKIVSGENIMSKIKTLQKNFGSETFGEGYSRGCQCKNQPIVVYDDEELKDWVEWKDLNNKERSFYKWPPDEDDKLYLICPGYENSQISFRAMTDQKYPVLPCCDKKQKFVDENFFEKKVENLGTDKKPNKNNYITKTLKTIEPGSYGQIPYQLNEFLNLTSDEKTYRRFSIYKGINNFISCLVETLFEENDIRDEELVDLRDKYPDDKRKIAEILRSKIYLKIKPALLKQELYDSTEEEIIEILQDTETNFSSKLFIRALEEIFNYNIFIFNEDENFEIPSHKDFHIRQINLNRKSVLIFKKNSTDEYDLIVHNDGIIFDTHYTELLSEKYYEVYSIFNLKYSDNLITMNETKYLNYHDMFEILTQKINCDGKMYAIDVVINQTIVTIFTPLSMPLNLDINEEIHLGDLETLNFLDTTYELNRTGALLDVSGMKGKMFFEIENIPEDLITTEDYYYRLTFNLSKINEVEIMHEKMRHAEILKQLIIWVFTTDTMVSVDEFFDKYIEIGKDGGVNLYEIPYVLPKNINNKKDAINSLNKTCPEIFKDSKIYLYPELHTNIYRWLSNYVKKIKPKNEKFLNDIFKLSTDFKNFHHNKVFMSMDDLNDWIIEDYYLTEGKYNVITNLSNIVLKQEPVFFEFNGIYLLQGVKNNLLISSLNVCKTWYKEGYNPGFNVNPYGDLEEFNYVIYDIINSNLVPVINKSNNKSDYYMILRTNYGYGAILEL